MCTKAAHSLMLSRMRCQRQCAVLEAVCIAYTTEHMLSAGHLQRSAQHRPHNDEGEGCGGAGVGGPRQCQVQAPLVRLAKPPGYGDGDKTLLR